MRTAWGRSLGQNLRQSNACIRPREKLTFSTEEKALDSIVLVRLRREDDDGNERPDSVECANGLDELTAVESRHHVVGDDEVWRHVLHLLEGVLSIEGLDDGAVGGKDRLQVPSHVI